MEEYTFKKDHELSPNFLKKNFYKLRYSLGNSNVDYWIVLPNYVKEFSTRENKLKSLDISLIGQYTSTTESFFDVEVFYEHLKFDINPSDWIMRKLSRLNETILEKDDFKDKSTGVYADVLTAKEISTGERFISRITVKKNFDYENGGANYVGVRVMCREVNYNNLSDFVLHTVYNWDFDKKGDWQLAERIVPHHIKMRNKLFFYVFESWKIFGEVAEPLNHLMIRQEANDQNSGVINIFEVETEKNANIEDLFKSYINRVELTDVDLNEIEDVSAILKNPEISHAWKREGIIQNTKEQFRSHATLYIILIENTYYYIESLGSSANYENYNWEINRRQSALILDSFNNKTFEQDNSKVIVPDKTEIVKEAEDVPENPEDRFKNRSIFFK